MATKTQIGELQGQEETQRAAAVGKRVIDSLGRPGTFHQMCVHRLWEGHYRVNIFVGLDAMSAKIAHSYFLVADASGNVVASTPRITKHYGLG